MRSFEPSDYRPRVLFTQVPGGYPPAMAWARRQQGRGRRDRAWGGRLRRAHLDVLAARRRAADERLNALGRLAMVGERLGLLSTSGDKPRDIPGAGPHLR